MSNTRTKLTYHDYLLLPDDGKVHELIGGEHFVSAAPNPRHQRVSRRIQFQLYRQLEETGRGEVFNAPIDLTLTDVDVVQPDLLVVLRSQADIVGETRLTGAPSLVVEVLSASTASRDRKLKRSLYEREGVPEYWLVDPERRQVTQIVLEKGRYRQHGSCREEITAATIPDVRVDLRVAWKEWLDDA